MAGHAVGIVAAAALCGFWARVVSPWHQLAWVLLVPWLVALDGARTWRAALASGVAMAVAFSIAVFAWFPVAMADYAAAPVWIAAAIGVLVAPFFQPAFVVFALARHGARVRGLGTATTALAGAAAYVGAEWMVPKLLGDTLGLGLYPSRTLRQAADLGGAGGLTFAVLLGNACVREIVAALRRRGVRRASVATGALAAIIGALALYGTLRLSTLDGAPREAALRVGVVQGNVAHYDRLAADVGTYEAVRRILDAQFSVTEDVLARGPVDVLVWPETVYPTTFGAPKSDEGAAFDRMIAGLVVRRETPLVFGSYDAEDGREYNAAMFLVPDGQGGVAFDVYRKSSLFPFTERVPRWLDGPWLRAWLPWMGSWEPGRGAATMPLVLRDGRRLRVAPLICYDAVDPRNAARGVRDGAELLMTLSNDSWLTRGAGADLHFLVSVFRSIETRRPQIRATPTGVSALIAPTGDLVRTRVNERAGVVADVTPVRDVVPLAVRWGEWLGPTALLLAGALLLLGGRR